jgi:hypothetical protein
VRGIIEREGEDWVQVYDSRIGEYEQRLYAFYRRMGVYNVVLSVRRRTQGK